MASVENVWCEGKLLSRIKSMYVDSSACVRVKEGESEWFRIDSGVEAGLHGCMPTPAMYNSVKLCKPFSYMECTSNKLDCEEGEYGGCL